MFKSLTLFGKFIFIILNTIPLIFLMLSYSNFYQSFILDKLSDNFISSFFIQLILIGMLFSFVKEKTFFKEKVDLKKFLLFFYGSLITLIFPFFIVFAYIKDLHYTEKSVEVENYCYECNLSKEECSLNLSLKDIQQPVQTVKYGSFLTEKIVKNLKTNKCYLKIYFIKKKPYFKNPYVLFEFFGTSKLNCYDKNFTKNSGYNYQ